MVHKVKIRAQGDKQCPVCGSRKTEIFFEALQLPVHVNVLWPEREDAQSVPKGDIKLAFCEQCGHIFNSAYNPDLIKYNDWYESSLHISSRYQSYSRPIADRLIESYAINNKDIINIGEGRVDFLELLCELGENRGIGFDPGYPDDPGNASTRQYVTFVQESNPDQYSRHLADLITCRKTLECIFKPREFVNMLRRAIGDRRETIGFIEVPSVLPILENIEIWEMNYEQYSYFSPSSLKYLFANHGFTILDQRDADGGKYLTIDVSPSIGTSEETFLSDQAELKALITEVHNFQKKVEEKIAFWRAKLEEIKSTGKSAALWNVDPKGTVFLNVLKAGDEIHQVIDIDPAKQDMFIAGSGHRVVLPTMLRNIRPDVIILMNSPYESDFRQLVSAMDLAPEYLLS